MVLVRFTENLARHCPVRDLDVAGATVREVLESAFAALPGVRSYVLDDQDGLRKHMAVFVDGDQIRDRVHLSDAVPAGAAIDVIQALSGG